MKKTLVLLLALCLFCAALPALAAEGGAVKVSVDTSKLPVYAADHRVVAGLLEEKEQPEDADLPVMVLPMKKSYDLKVTVLPKTVKNKKVSLSVDNGEIAKVSGNTVTGLAEGETVLTVTSKQDPNAAAKYRLLVVRPVSRIALTPSAKSVAVGKQIQIEAAYIPANATIQAVTWRSEDKKVATVDANGVVTGVGRGETRIVATARDGSVVRANIAVKVTQLPQKVSLGKKSLTVDVNKTAVLKATVTPANANNRNVVWSTSDPKVATVNADGRVKGVSVGECEITCTCKANKEVSASVIIHVQQPVTKIVFDTHPSVYIGEKVQVKWHVTPANATNPKVKFTSSAPKIASVAADGTITGRKHGSAYITAVSTDGSQRRARFKVNVLQHVTGVHMLRKTAYVCVKETSIAGAILEPRTADDHRMTWVSEDPKIATVSGKQNRVSIKGIRKGETTVTGTTHDGGYQTSILVKIGDWDNALKIKDAYVRDKYVFLAVQNVSNLKITRVTAEVSVLDGEGKPIPLDAKGNNTFTMVYRKTLKHNAVTPDDAWQNAVIPLTELPPVSQYVIKITQYEINNDWIKTIQKQNRPSRTV